MLARTNDGVDLIPLSRGQYDRLRLRVLQMAAPRPKISDGVILGCTISMMGAPVVYPHFSELIGTILFWGGLAFSVGWIAFRYLAQPDNAEALRNDGPQTDNTGAFAGRDNNGTQQVIHGDVHYHAPRPSPPSTLQADTGGEINAHGADLPANFPFPFAKASTGGRINMQGLKVRDLGDGTFSVEPQSMRTQQKQPRREDDYISLLEAARVAFECVEGTPAEQYTCGLNRTPEQRLGYFIEELLNSGAKFFGKKQPSSVLREIPADALAELSPIKGKNELHHLFEKEAQHYVDVKIDWPDFHNYIAELTQRVEAFS